MVVVAGLVIGLVLATHTLGGNEQDAAQESLYPDSPAGSRLSWFVEGTNEPGAFDATGQLSPNFAAMASPERLHGIVSDFHEEAGTLRVVKVREAGPFALSAVCSGTAGKHWDVRIRTENEEPHRVDSLSFSISDYWSAPALASWSELDECLDSLPGEVGLAVWQVSGEDRRSKLHGHLEEVRLAIGSTFKLYVLGALAEAVKSDKTSWDRRLALRDEWKAIGSGELRQRPAGDELTVLELATEMIAISDNTATDHLIHHVGRENVEVWMSRHHGEPGLNIPFMTTREFFGLKYGEDRRRLERYAQATPAERRGILAEAAQAEPVRYPSEVPVAIDEVEWFASVDELCRLMFTLHDMSEAADSSAVMQALTTRRHGIQLDPDHWKVVAYKGGREKGVLNLTWLLQRFDGRWFAVSATFNNGAEDVPAEKAAELSVAAIRLLARVD